MTTPTIHRFPIALRELEVVAIRDVSPRMRRVTLAGEQLGAFRAGGQDLPELESLGPSDHVKLLFPDPATGILSLPEQGDGRLFWPENPPAISREYTPRSYRRGEGRLDLEFVLHGHGVAGLWAEQVQIGQRLHVAGPRASKVRAPAQRYVLIGDESALPALANWLESLPDGPQVTAHVLVGDDSARIDLPAPKGAQIHWHPHDTADLQALVRLAGDLSDADGLYLWAAGERAAIGVLREHLATLDLSPDSYDLSSYWTLDPADQ